jgi:hypothetical protein
MNVYLIFICYDTHLYFKFYKHNITFITYREKNIIFFRLISNKVLQFG